MSIDTSTAPRPGSRPGEGAEPTPPPSARPRLAVLLGRQPLGIVFAAPYALFLAAVFAYPLGLAVWISFHDYFFAAPGATVERPFVGLDNYTAVLGDPAVRESFVNVAEFLVINVPLTVVLSLLLATALNGAVRGRALLRVAYYVPYVTASVALVAVWLFLFAQDGMVNEAARPAGTGPVVAGQQRAGDAGDRGLRHLEAARVLHPALPGRAAERAEGALRVRCHRRRLAVPLVLARDRARASGRPPRSW